MKAPARILFHQTTVGTAEAQALARALKAGNLAGNGPICKRVEAKLKAKLRCGRAFLTPSGTAALELALMALGLGPGDEVILPSFNFVSDANAVLRQGCTPVFADVLPQTFCLDPADAARRISPRTKAIILVHYGGLACDMDAFLALKRKHGLALIEDAALGLGAAWRGRPLGSIGDLGCFSFHATKQVSCGEGGALVTSRKDLAAKIEVMQEKGTDRSAFLRGEKDRYTWRSLGSSYLLSDLLAALLELQLAKAPALQRRLLKIWHAYQSALQPLQQAGLLRLAQPSPLAQPNGHLFWLLLDGPWKGRRPEVLEALKSAGIPATFHYVPLHSSPFGRQLFRKQGSRKNPASLPVTELADHNLLRLPMHAGLSLAQVARICGQVKKILEAA